MYNKTEVIFIQLVLNFFILIISMCMRGSLQHRKNIHSLVTVATTMQHAPNISFIILYIFQSHVLSTLWQRKYRNNFLSLSTKSLNFVINPSFDKEKFKILVEKLLKSFVKIVSKEARNSSWQRKSQID